MSELRVIATVLQLLWRARMIVGPLLLIGLVYNLVTGQLFPTEPNALPPAASVPSGSPPESSLLAAQPPDLNPQVLTDVRRIPGFRQSDADHDRSLIASAHSYCVEAESGTDFPGIVRNATSRNPAYSQADMSALVAEAMSVYCHARYEQYLASLVITPAPQTQPH